MTTLALRWSRSGAPHPMASELLPVARLSAPLIALNLLTFSALAVDTAMCGALPDAERALTGLGFATQYVYLMAVGVTGVSVGTVALMARAHGARQGEVVDRTLYQSLATAVLVGGLTAVLGNLVAAPFLGALGASGPALEDALHYVRPLATGSVFSYVGLILAAGMRAVGNTWWPFLIGLAGNVLNVVLNYGLILGNWGMPQLGVAGAAYGTLISQGATAVALAVLLLRGVVPGLRLSPRWRRLDPKVVLAIVRIGTPAALDFTMLNVAYLSVVGLLGHVEPAAVAAHGIGMRIQLLAFIPALAISQATAAIVGQYLGGGAPERARQATWAALAQTLVLMTALPLLVLAFVGPLLEAFGVGTGTELASLTRTWMTIMGISLPILGANIVFVGLMQGAGLTLKSFQINALSTLLLQIPFGLAAVHVFDLGPVGAWLSIPVGFGARALLGAWVFLAGKWSRVALPLAERSGA